MNGLISKIQKFSTRDGPGIRSTVFAVGCPLSCKWCANPELILAGEKIFRHKDRCTGCGRCAAFTELEARAAACFHDAYERVGVTLSARELAEKLLRDQAFYEQSGGGVTYSGGEAALQANFFLETTGILKQEQIHVALDTCGHLPWENLSPLVQAVDLVLFDVKAMDSNLHKQYTGAGNELILENAKKIADTGKEMIARLIIVPGVNDSDEDIEGRLEFARSLGILQVDLLGYHRLGAGKYAALGLQDPMASTPECPCETLRRAAKKAANMGLAAFIGG